MGLTARDVLKAGAPIALATATLIPVVRTRVSVTPLDRRLAGNASSQLSALVVREASGDRVIDCEQVERTLESLRETVQGLAGVLDATHA